MSTQSDRCRVFERICMHVTRLTTSASNYVSTNKDHCHTTATLRFELPGSLLPVFSIAPHLSQAFHRIVKISVTCHMRY